MHIYQTHLFEYDQGDEEGDKDEARWNQARKEIWVLFPESTPRSI